MNAKPLSERELKRLARIDRKLLGGRGRFGAFGLLVGIGGGLAWVALMAAAAPGFTHGMHVTPPHDGQPLLELAMYWLATHFGPLIAVCVVAGGMFGALGGALSVGLAWPVMVQNHADLAARAIACNQFEPKFSSAALRRRLAQT